jgi:hypothetical protein
MITTRKSDGIRHILRDGDTVGAVRVYGNGRYGITDLDSKTVSDESFGTIKELCEDYERVTTWLPFGDVARGRLGQQCQYASRLIDGRHGSPRLGDGLRFQDRTGGPVDVSDYHDIRIHRDDIETFVERVLAWRAENGTY